jgi:hypothetical protein
MIAIIRWVISFIDKEHVLVNRYRKSHPHFIWFLSLEALISGALIVGGLHFFGPTLWTSHEEFMIEHPGVIPMPVDKFLDYVTREAETVYWLGPAKRNSYTIDTSANGMYVVTYIPQDPISSHSGALNMSITTDKNLAVYKKNLHAAIDAGSQKIALENGDTVEFSNDSPNAEVITLSGRPEVITIRYPTMQSANNLIKNADRLKIIG